MKERRKVKEKEEGYVRKVQKRGTQKERRRKEVKEEEEGEGEERERGGKQLWSGLRRYRV